MPGFLPALVLLFAIFSTPALAASPTFRVWGSPWIYYVPIEEYGKPFEGQLADGTLIVHVFEHATSSDAIDVSSGKVLVQADKLVLCYKKRPVKATPGKPIVGVVYTQVLEYTLPGFPARKYSYQLSQNCK